METEIIVEVKTKIIVELTSGSRNIEVENTSRNRSYFECISGNRNEYQMQKWKKILLWNTKVKNNNKILSSAMN